ncbi:hypothetical protein [Corynebacterium hindlerae]|uniref:hypothetical protein n=1 Tax=Corynebacterium hindlerae TaxID=699041 RepID=UPI003AAFA02B
MGVILPAEVNAWNRYRETVEKSRSAATPEERQAIVRSGRQRYWAEIGKIHGVQVDNSRPPENPAKVHPITGMRRQFINSRQGGTPGRRRNIKNAGHVRRIG